MILKHSFEAQKYAVHPRQQRNEWVILQMTQQEMDFKR